MKDKIQQRILELRTELGEYDPEPVQLQIDEMRRALDEIVNEHNQEMERVTTLNNELVYWLDVLDSAEKLEREDDILEGEIVEPEEGGIPEEDDVIDGEIEETAPSDEEDVEELPEEDLEEEAELNKEELE